MSAHRIPTGTPKVDELIEGGFPADSMILLTGYPGAGKTIFSGQFLYNCAVKYGTRGVYACFAETRETFLRNMMVFGWDFERLEREGRTSVLNLSVSKEAGVQTNLNTIMDTMNSLNAEILVIDSITAIAVALKEDVDIRVMLHLLYKILKKYHCLSILIVDEARGIRHVGHEMAEFVADGIIRLETYFDDRDVLRRRMRILKMRGTDHSKTAHPYVIGREGFTIISTPREKKKSSKQQG